MKPFKGLVKQYRKWSFNRMKRSDSKIDRRVITSCEKVTQLPNISPEYVLRLKIYKTLSEQALKTNDPTQYYNIRDLQTSIIALLKQEVENYNDNPATNNDNRPRPGVA